MALIGDRLARYGVY